MRICCVGVRLFIAFFHVKVGGSKAAGLAKETFENMQAQLQRQPPIDIEQLLLADSDDLVVKHIHASNQKVVDLVP